MAVTISSFGTMSNGQSVEKITLTNAAGNSVSMLSYGATIQALMFNGKDLVLGFDTLEAYFASDAYIGATIGRVCNRIDGGRFDLNGIQYKLACNEGARNAHLHGGNIGFNQKVWDYKVIQEELPAVRFTVISEDGEEGYPGRLALALTVSFGDDNTLSLQYNATADKDTPVNFTNHVYFNLNGCDCPRVDSTLLQVNAEEYTVVNDRLIPTGAYALVADTILDFRTSRPMGETFVSDDPLVASIGGVDHNFVLAHGRRPLSEAVVAFSPDSGVRLTCCTDLPGVQIYTGNATDEKDGKYGLHWGQHQGFCIETQFYPDSVNHPEFPSTILKAGETYFSVTTYRFEQIEG